MFQLTICLKEQIILIYKNKKSILQIDFLFCLIFYSGITINTSKYIESLQTTRPIRSETLSPCFPWSGRKTLCFFPFINLTFRSLNGQIYKPVNSRMSLLLHKVFGLNSNEKSKTKSTPIGVLLFWLYVTKIKLLYSSVYFIFSFAVLMDDINIFLISIHFSCTSLLL